MLFGCEFVGIVVLFCFLVVVFVQMMEVGEYIYMFAV